MPSKGASRYAAVVFLKVPLEGRTMENFLPQKKILTKKPVPPNGRFGACMLNKYQMVLGTTTYFLSRVVFLDLRVE